MLLYCDLTNQCKCITYQDFKTVERDVGWLFSGQRKDRLVEDWGVSQA